MESLSPHKLEVADLSSCAIHLDGVSAVTAHDIETYISRSRLSDKWRCLLDEGLPHATHSSQGDDLPKSFLQEFACFELFSWLERQEAKNGIAALCISLPGNTLFQKFVYAIETNKAEYTWRETERTSIISYVIKSTEALMEQLNCSQDSINKLEADHMPEHEYQAFRRMHFEGFNHGHLSKKGLFFSEMFQCGLRAIVFKRKVMDELYKRCEEKFGKRLTFHRKPSVQ